jgi:membrane protein DedA with SNARE-associated domain
MSDLRNTDPYRSDQSRRYGAQQGFWPWLTTALTALGLIIGGIIGYNWGASHERTVLLNPPTTTGSAPSQQQPAPHNR